LTGAHEHAAVSRSQREDVPGFGEIARSGLRVNRRQDCLRAIMNGDSRRDATPRFDRHTKRRAMRRRVCGVGNHQGNVKIVKALACHRETDQSAAMRGHEINRVRRDFVRRNHEIAFVLAVLVIHNDDEPAVLNVEECVFYRCKFHAVSRCSMRSTYFAITSYSRLTMSPVFTCRRFVFSNVCGIIAISTVESCIAATVRLMPSMAMEPFSTI